MDAKETLQKVKEFFNELVGNGAPAVPPAPAAPNTVGSEYELKIGGKVTIDKVEVGGVVMIDGAPALPGDIELVDGTLITVGDNGVITAVTKDTNDNGAGAAGPAANDMSAKFTEFETSTNEKFTAYDTKFAAYEQRFAEYELKLGKATKVIEELLKLSQLIVDQPAAKPDPAVRQNNFKTQQKDEPNQILENLERGLF